MTVTIRQATIADRPELAKMLGEVVAHFESLAPGSFPDTPSPEALWETSGLSFTPNPVCVTLVAEAGGRLAGYLAYHFGVWEIYPALYVAGLYVRPDVQRTGIGRRLMAEAATLARARGATHVTWEVWRLNPRAVTFYETIGAEIVDDNLRMMMRA